MSDPISDTPERDRNDRSEIPPTTDRQPETHPDIPSETPPDVGRSPRRRSRHLSRLAVLGLIMVSAITVLLSDPSSRAHWYWAASLDALEAGDVDTALAQAQAAVDTAPADSWLRTRYAELLFRLDREEEALEQALKSVELQPDDFLQMGHTAYLLGRMKQHEKARELLDQTVEGSLAGGNIHRHHARNQRAYGIALAYADGAATQEDLQVGLEDIELAIEEYGDHPAYLDTRGYLLLHAGRLKEAQRDLDQAIRQYEQIHADLLADLAAKKKEGSARIAVQATRRDIEASLAVMYHHRGELYQEQGRTELAERDQQRAERFGLSRKLGNW